MDKYFKQLRPRTDYKWHCDEIHFKVRKQARWLFAVMDGASRFILSHDISVTKMGYKPFSLFATARNPVGVAPWVLVTDGLQVFRPAARKTFWNSTNYRWFTSGRFTCRTASTTTTYTRDLTVNSWIASGQSVNSGQKAPRRYGR